MSSYAVVAIGVSLFLVLGLRPGTWALLRIALAVHLMGDVIFGPVWLMMPTYGWMKYVAESDRERAALFLALVVCLSDVAYRLLGRLFAAARAGQSVDARWLDTEQTEAPDHRPRPASFPSAFFVVGLALKLVFLGATGVLTGARSVGELRPDDSLGLGAVLFLSDFLIPYGLAAFRRSRRSRRVELDLVVLAGISYFSFSKAAFITYVVVYAMAYLFAFGHRETRKQLISWRLAFVVLVAFVSLGIKTQQRGGATVTLTRSVLTEQAVGGASARFMGGIFRAYTVTYREILAGWPPLGGGYHAQTLVLAVPRFLWPDKPRVASEQLYYLLGVTEEPYGTAFAVNVYGAMLFDFGIAGTLVGAVFLGLLLRLGDEHIPSWQSLRWPSNPSALRHYLATAWLCMAIPLSEGGLPIMFVNFAMLAAAFIPIEGGSRILHRVLFAAGSTTPGVDHVRIARQS